MQITISTKRHRPRSRRTTQRTSRTSCTSNYPQTWAEISLRLQKERKIIIKKQAYPIILTPYENIYVVSVPDFSINTQGETIEDAIEMAIDAIGGVGMVRENEKIPFPKPSPIHAVVTDTPEDIVTLALVDFEAYRRKVDSRVVKKNCTIPSWLNADAERAGVNFSAILQKGLKEELGIS